MAVLLGGLLLLVLFLYGRSVAGGTRHALTELFRFLTLVLGLVFVAGLLVLLYLYT